MKGHSLRIQNHYRKDKLRTIINSSGEEQDKNSSKIGKKKRDG
jgi:hypothetical protein